MDGVSNPVGSDEQPTGLPSTEADWVRTTPMTSCWVSANGGAPREYLALWDTGADLCLVTPRVIEECGLTLTGEWVDVDHFGGLDTVPMVRVDIQLADGAMLRDIEAARGRVPAGIDVVLGMGVIERGVLTVWRKESVTESTFTARQP